MQESEIRALVRELVEGQRLAVLATYNGRRPHASLVAYASTSDMRRLLFATSRDSEKFVNLTSNPKAAMLIDSRSDSDRDLRKASAVTAYGTALESKPRAGEDLVKLFLLKQPGLEAFLRASYCALVEVRVEKYRLVTDFQAVSELNIEN